jgi:hypothetical protein
MSHPTRHAVESTSLATTLRLTALTVAMALGGCAVAPTPGNLQQVRAQANPVDVAQRTVTNFTPALRCMDDLMLRSGVRDISLMTEELRDSTQRVPVNARDMMISAFSEMNRRSRAMRVSTFGNDQIQLTTLLQQAQKTEAFSAVPQYSLRGSISQIDEDVQRSGGLLGAVAQRFGVRLASETRFSMLGFDAALVDTRDFSVVPGVSSKNTTVITRRDANASDGQAQLRGASAVFSFSAARSEGTAQAARNMVELAAVELAGKLTRLPYWQCLGVSDDQADVQHELDDWVLGMSPPERIRLAQERLREQRYYNGPADGRPSIALQQSVRAALSAWATAPQRLGVSRPRLPASGALLQAEDPDFTRLLLSQPLPKAAALPRSEQAARLALATQTMADGRIKLQLTSNRDGFVYCYAIEEASGNIRRIFPNRFARDPAIQAGRVLQVPGTSSVQLTAQNAHACVHSPTEVYADLPSSLRWGDFETVRLNDMQAIVEAFAQSSGQPVAMAEVGAASGGAAVAAAPAGTR